MLKWSLGGAECLEVHLRPPVRLHHVEGEVFGGGEVDAARLQERGHLRRRRGPDRNLLSAGGSAQGGGTTTQQVGRIG